ncbi:MAG: 30S ribosomal protein S9 [Elusimicrobiota bacterium]|nr:30S ribosomal protein S9 [Endomicrobiia bacterium]MDW8165000.1 30S ribosomal protein S9 [Elusimicrobiota bacterium]
MQQQILQPIRATGRRKTSVAVAVLKNGTGKITINNKTLDEYFGGNLTQKTQVISPLVLTGLKDKLDIEVEAKGGGITGQADAIKLAIARALVIYNPDLRATLKKAGMLRRDPRMVERKKPGKPKARKSFQWTKR